jgi:hypothetical protein
MKALMLVLLTLGMAHATVYDFYLPETSIQTQTNGTYELKSEISVEIETILRSEAAIIIDGNREILPIYKVRSYRDGAFLVSDYIVTLSSDVLVDQTCDEREAISYKLKFSRKVSIAGGSNVNVRLEAQREYTYDWCHSSPSYETIEYLIK